MINQIDVTPRNINIVTEIADISRNYIELQSDAILQLNKNYYINGLSKLNLILPSAANSDRVTLYSASLAGFKVVTDGFTIIKHSDRSTSVNGALESMELGTHVLIEKVFDNWLMTIFSGYCKLT